MMNSLPWTYPADSVRRHAVREAVAVLLSRASELLAHLARQLSTAVPRADVEPGPPMLEFHAEAGAPEGALYVNGRLVGHLEGVIRL
jgi:hypothetical protein